MVSMTLADLLRETLAVDCDEVWENERTPNTLIRVRGAPAFDGTLSSGSRRSTRITRYRSVERRDLELDTYAY